MENNKILIRPQDSQSLVLPGIIHVPDGKKQVALGSGTITSLVNSGGMAIVYEIWNQELEVKRAVKLLKPDHSHESEDRFHTEMKISAKLHHPNIVEIYSVGTWNEQLPYIEMELIDGVTLEKLIHDAGSLPPDVCTSICIMIGRALNYAHNQSYMLYGKRYQGVIHRDLKPGNIMLARDGIVKLMDFGIAKPMSASIHTIEGVVMGTMQYLAPEQLDGKEIDPRADLYSLGVVLYEMLTGTQAFPEQNIAKLVNDKLNNKYIILSEYSANIPNLLINLVHKLIRCEKETRVQNVLEFLRSVCKIHKTLTLKAPEQVIEEFLKSNFAEHKKVLTKKKKTIVPIFIWSFTALAFVISAWFALSHIKSDPLQPIVSFIQSIKMLADPSSQLENPDPNRFAKRVDSVLLLQKREPPITSLKPTEPSIEIPKPQPVATISQNHHNETKMRPLTKKNIFAKIKQQKKIFYPIPPIVQVIEKPIETPVVVAPPPPPQHPKPLVEILRTQYNTTDLMTIFSREVEVGNFTNALEMYTLLPKDLATSKKGKLYRIRALKGSKDETALRKIFTTNDIYDGEYYLEKALFLFNVKDCINARDFFRRASKTPCQYLSQKQFRPLLLYSNAVNATALYDQTKIEDAKKEALEAWSEVRTTYKSLPNHPYCKSADIEIKRLTQNIAMK